MNRNDIMRRFMVVLEKQRKRPPSGPLQQSRAVHNEYNVMYILRSKGHNDGIKREDGVVGGGAHEIV